MTGPEYTPDQQAAIDALESLVESHNAVAAAYRADALVSATHADSRIAAATRASLALDALKNLYREREHEAEPEYIDGRPAWLSHTFTIALVDVEAALSKECRLHLAPRGAACAQHPSSRSMVCYRRVNSTGNPVVGESSCDIYGRPKSSYGP